MADVSAPPSGPAKPTPTPPVTPAEESPEEATARLVEGVAADEVALVDDFGDVAVTRIAQDAGHRHVVLERVAGEWRVRQLYETAKGAG